MPVGAIIAWVASTPPNGWLELNGKYLDRSRYPELLEFARSLGARSIPPNAKGDFDIVTHRFYSFGFLLTDIREYLGLPDLRGEFIRGWDNQARVDPGRELGSWQESQGRLHSHRIPGRSTTATDTGHTSSSREYHTPRNIAYMYIMYTGRKTR
jgi:microcystin-dependent protein